MKSKKKKLIFLSSVLALSIAAIIAMSVIYVYNDYINRQGQQFYADLSVFFTPPPSQNRPAVNGTDDSDASGSSAAIFVPTLDFEGMRSVYPDVVGWIHSEGTEINYPIVQTMDNDFYLDHLPDQTPNILGSIFLDYRNQLGFHGRNVFIYGHNTATGTMFGTLKKYTDQQYYEQNKMIRLYTPENNFNVTLFAGYLLDSLHEHPPFIFADEEEFNQYIDEIKTRSFFQSDEQVSFGDTLVFICTCQEGQRGEARSRRRVIVGRLEAE